MYCVNHRSKLNQYPNKLHLCLFDVLKERNNWFRECILCLFDVLVERYNWFSVCIVWIVGRSRISTQTRPWFRSRASTLKRKWRGTAGSAWRTFIRPRLRKMGPTTDAFGERLPGRMVTVVLSVPSSSPIFPLNQWCVYLSIEYFCCLCWWLDFWIVMIHNFVCETGCKSEGDDVSQQYLRCKTLFLGFLVWC